MRDVDETNRLERFLGVMGRSSSFTVVIILGLVLNAAVVCNGGITSSFVRKVEKTNDMPLDSDVFRVPLGYNAPQQVCVAILPPFALLFTGIC